MKEYLLQVHATAISIDHQGVLIRGGSGSGKSDLALRLIDEGADLIADDRCDLDIRTDQIILSGPQVLGGLIEVRGIGIVEVGAQTCIPLVLIVDIVEPETIERMPEQVYCEDYRLKIPLVKLAAFHASTPAKIHLALNIAAGNMELQE